MKMKLEFEFPDKLLNDIKTEVTKAPDHAEDIINDNLTIFLGGDYPGGDSLGDVLIEEIKKILNIDKSNFSERLMRCFSYKGMPDYSDDSYNDDSYIDDSYEPTFTQEEKDLVTKACFVISNINWALRYLGRGPEPGYDKPTGDKAYRVLDDPTRLNITNKLFDFNADIRNLGVSNKDKELLSSIMKKIRDYDWFGHYR